MVKARIFYVLIAPSEELGIVVTDSTCRKWPAMAASVYNLVFRTDVVIELTENAEAWPTRGSEIATIDSAPGTVQDIQHFSISYDPHTSTFL